MYGINGTFDSCPDTNRDQYDRGGYGGMSGSNAYRIDGDSRYVYSVASTSDRATYTRHCDMAGSTFDWIGATLIPGATPDTVDFVSLWTRATPGSPAPRNAGAQESRRTVGRARP